MSPINVTLGSNSATIVEIPGTHNNRAYSRIIEWNDIDLDGNPVKVILKLGRHGNSFVSRMEEWNPDGDRTEALRHFEGFLNPSDKL